MRNLAIVALVLMGFNAFGLTPRELLGGWKLADCILADSAAQDYQSTKTTWIFNEDNTAIQRMHYYFDDFCGRLVYSEDFKGRYEIKVQKGNGSVEFNSYPDNLPPSYHYITLIKDVLYLSPGSMDAMGRNSNMIFRYEREITVP